MSRLTPFSYVILVLVGEGGAGPHDLVRMMRLGRIYWSAPESQFYAEPKKLAEGGYLTATKQPGRTHERTHYELTAKGREALEEWLATPARFARIQNEPIVRVLGSEYVDKATLLQSLGALRAEIAQLSAQLDEQRAGEERLPHRARALRLNNRLARRILQAHLEWLDDVEREL